MGAVYWNLVVGRPIVIFHNGFRDSLHHQFALYQQCSNATSCSCLINLLCV